MESFSCRHGFLTHCEALQWVTLCLSKQAPLKARNRRLITRVCGSSVCLGVTVTELQSGWSMPLFICVCGVCVFVDVCVEQDSKWVRSHREGWPWTFVLLFSRSFVRFWFEKMQSEKEKKLSSSKLEHKEAFFFLFFWKTSSKTE